MNKLEYQQLYKKMKREYRVDILTYKDFKSAFKDFKSIRPKPTSSKDDQKKTLELYSFIWGLMAMSIQKQDTDNIELSNQRTVYFCLMTQIANGCSSVLTQLDNGFEFQANHIIRNLIELSYTLIVVILNKEKCKQYFDSAKLKNQYSIWNKNFRLSKLDEELSKYELQFIDDLDFIKELSMTRKQIYTMYSSFSHNDFLTCYLGCYSPNKNMLTNPNYALPYNLWGSYNNQANIILASINQLMWLSLLYFRHIIGKTDLFRVSNYVDPKCRIYWDTAIFTSFQMHDEYCSYISNHQENN